MTLPIIAIVGRPNVGKSRLFNRLIGGVAKALVDDQPGVTRDRHYAVGDWRGQQFIVVDTGGLIPGAEDPLNKKVWGQAFLAIQEADIIICLLDGMEGLNPVDEVLVKELRKIDKPVFYAVNKVDEAAHENNVVDFTRMGLKNLIPVSAEHGRGVSDLLEGIYTEISRGTMFLTRNHVPHEEPCTSCIRVAIIGRPNVGKSTLINRLAGQERVVVHEEAGTTRDAIDVVIEKGKQKMILVDTAGIKKKSATKTRLEKFSAIKSLKAIDHSDVVCLLIDASQGLTHQDLQLAHTVWEAKKGLIVLINKWDLMKASMKKYMEDITPQFGELREVPIRCISAQTGAHCDEVWKQVFALWQAMQKRISTAVLNAWLEKIVVSHPLPMYKQKDVKLYYATQVGISPQHFVLFTNYPQGVPQDYRRYLMRQLKKAMGVEGVPLILSFRVKK